MKRTQNAFYFTEKTEAVIGGLPQGPHLPASFIGSDADLDVPSFNKSERGRETETERKRHRKKEAG